MKRMCNFTVLSIINFENDDFMIRLSPFEGNLEGIKAGQFVNIEVPKSPKTFLRRPISVANIDEKNNEMWLYVRKVGDGTVALGALKQGDLLNIIYPLGNGYDIENIKNPLLIGGGTGMAPMLFLAKMFIEKGIQPTVLLGCRTKSALSLLPYFEGIDKMYIATDDGSEGEKCIVSQHSIMNQITNHDKIYTCGPEVMMQAVAKIATKFEIPCEVSLENTMACGIGACLCCVTPTKSGNQCVCTEGPVFLATELKEFIN